MNHHIRTADGRLLAGPRTPAEVRRTGYGFTSNPATAWSFPTEKQAQAKLRVVSRHMGGSLELEVVS
jgi:hypothetical protein